jgi:hypothetical protein
MMPRKLTRSALYALEGGLRFQQAYLCLGLISLELRLLGFRHFLRRVPSAAAQPVGPSAFAHAARDARVIEWAAHWQLLRTHCLERSAVLHLWLRRAGLPSELRIGVRRQGSGVAAHAWVELGGIVVNDRPASLTRFTPLFSQRATPELESNP